MVLSPALSCNPWLLEKPSESHEEPHLDTELEPACTPAHCAFELVLLRVGSWRAQHNQLLGRRTMVFLHFLIPTCFSYKHAKLQWWRDAPMLQRKWGHHSTTKSFRRSPQGHSTPQLLCRGLNLFVTGQKFVSIPNMCSKDNTIYPMGKFWGLR